MILIKVGGGDRINWDGVCRDIASLMNGERILLVHGASVRRDAIAARLQVPVKTVISPSGISSVYTDRESLEVFLMVYAGLVNKEIVARLHRFGVPAVGLSGVDGKLWQAKAKKEILVKEENKVKLLKGNLTGRVEKVNTDLVRLLLDNGYCPVISSPAISFENEIVNTDNDWAVAVMAESLKIRTLVSLFEAPGLLRDPDDEGSVIPRIDREAIDDFLPCARGRMQKKILGAKRAIEGGVETIYWGDGRVENPIRLALQGKGTVICGKEFRTP
jgi:acetylglutamate/LysW-gamma-L-alpha-aminoadipate kinase